MLQNQSFIPIFVTFSIPLIFPAYLQSKLDFLLKLPPTTLQSESPYAVMLQHTSLHPMVLDSFSSETESVST